MGSGVFSSRPARGVVEAKQSAISTKPVPGIHFAKQRRTWSLQKMGVANTFYDTQELFILISICLVVRTDVKCNVQSCNRFDTLQQSNQLLISSKLWFTVWIRKETGAPRQTCVRSNTNMHYTYNFHFYFRFLEV